MTSERLPLAVFAIGLGFLAAWTLGVHVATLNALPFVSLYVVFAVAVAAAAVAARYTALLRSVLLTDAVLLPKVELQVSAFRLLNWKSVAGLLTLGLLLAATAALQYKTGDFLPFWILCLVTAGVALATTPAQGDRAVCRLSAATVTRDALPPGLGFLLVGAFMLGFYYLTSIPDADDTLFLNLATGAKREREALYAVDTMLGIPGLDFMKSTYRLESYQLLAALISDATGLTVMQAAHVVVPAAFCLWSASILVLIHYALFRSSWMIGVLFHLCWLVALDGSVQSYGFHGIARFFHGKGPFVTAVLPLIAFLTFTLVCQYSRVLLFLLGCVIVGALGLTANAIYAGPLTVALSAAPFFLAGDRAQRLTCLRLIAVVIYPGALAVYLVLFDPPAPSQISVVQSPASAVWGVFGSRYGYALGLAVFLAAAAAGFIHRAARKVSLYLLVLMSVVMNPFLWGIYGENITGNINYRLLWSVPVPLLLAVFSCMLWGSRLRALQFGMAVAMALLLVAPASIIHRAEWGPALLKVPQPDYRIAKAINAAVPEGGIVLAPEEISTWIPTLDDGRPVVEGRMLYTPQRQLQLAPETLGAVTAATEFLNRKAGSQVSQEEFIRAIQSLNVSVIVIASGLPGRDSLLKEIASLGFGQTMQIDSYTVFVRARGQN